MTTFPEEAAYWTDDADGDPVLPAGGGSVSVPPPAPDEVDWAAAVEQSQRNLAAAGLLGAVYAPVLGPGARKYAAPPASEAADPVPPPVDALLKAVKEYGITSYDLCAVETRDGISEVTKASDEDEAARSKVETLARDLWAAGVAEGRRLEESATLQEIEQRERAEEIADRLTDAIARHLGTDFGEHSNRNDPWGNALIVLAEYERTEEQPKPITRCAARSNWYLAGRWTPGPCYLPARHPGTHLGSPDAMWTPARALEFAARHHRLPMPDQPAVEPEEQIHD